MEAETVCISKAEYTLLKKKAEVDDKLLEKIARGLEDIKAGRVRKWD